LEEKLWAISLARGVDEENCRKLRRKGKITFGIVEAKKGKVLLHWDQER
jgi:hypothetical protein